VIMVWLSILITREITNLCRKHEIFFIFVENIYTQYMERIGIETTQNVSIDYSIASVGDRLGAFLIDGLIQIAYWIIVAVLVNEYADYSVRDSVYMFALFPYMFYHLLMEIFLGGQSIGKKAVKIKVVRVDGAQATIGNYIVRWLFRIVDIALFWGIVALIVISANGKGQRLGDMVAKTTVISLRRKGQLKATIYKEIPKNYQIKHQEVHLLSEDDIRTIKEVLDNYKRNPLSDKAGEYIHKTCGAVEKKMGVVRNTTPGQFLESVLLDYNYYFTHIAQ